ncbi:thioredoxin domain-containing protein [Candidatus Pacearchaeota archaeon]|nr:thioredoxin domain-containing protein [Candidatus Pacearchaeota archaeon]
MSKKNKEDDIQQNETSEENSEEDEMPTLMDKFRDNPWIVSTTFLGIIVFIFLIGGLFGIPGASGNVVSQEDASVAVQNLLEEQTGGQAQLKNIEEFNDYFYKATITLQDQDLDLFVTKDAEFYSFQLVPLQITTNPQDQQTQDNSETSSPELPQQEKPVADLYIWSYCPYGVTALGPFAEVASLLGDFADFKVYLYYAGHGDFEEQQNKIQACIQEISPEKYWDYAKTFAEEIYEECYGDAECDLTESTALMNSLGINSNEVLACVESQGDTLLENDYNAAREAGVSGSPTLVINGVKANVARTAEAYKTAVCSGFTDETLPEQCDVVLDSTGTTASGSC